MGDTEAEQAEAERTTVEIPWMDEPLAVDEAVEVVAQAFNEEADDAEALTDRIERLEGRLDEMESQIDEMESRIDGSDGGGESDLTDRVETLERCVEASNDGTTVTCPSCGSGDQVLKSGVAAAVLVRKEALSDGNVGALNEESHLCLSCRKGFTPCEVGGDDDYESLV